MHPLYPFNCTIFTYFSHRYSNTISIYFLHTHIYIPFSCTETVGPSCAVLKYSPTIIPLICATFSIVNIALYATIMHAVIAPILNHYNRPMQLFFNIVSI